MVATTREARAADEIVRTLVGQGVDVFFGIPGGPVSPLFNAILNNPRARLIESRHETGAAFAAAGYYRACGRVACVVVTAGPGATNVVTGVASAHFEQVPMIVICGDVAWAAAGGRLLQDTGPEGLDVENMLRSIVRATYRLPQAGAAASYATAAVQAARNQKRPGPVLLVVPIHFGNAKADTLEISLGDAGSSFNHLSADTVEEVLRLLQGAERPLLVFGAGARSHSTALAALVAEVQIPFVTTPRAKGIVSEKNPMSLGHGGLAASAWAREYTARGVDVALVIGTDLDDCSVNPTPYIREGGRLIHVDREARVFNRNLRTHLGIVADIGDFIDAIRKHEMTARFSSVRRLDVSEIKRKSAFEPLVEHSSGQISPARALLELQAMADSDARFVTDIGEHMLFALHYIQANGPDHFVINIGLGSMGSGIGSAIGLALGEPERQVICVCGDGGMQMMGMEILVAIRHKLNIVFAIFNDSRYNMVYHGYKQVFGQEAPWDNQTIDFAEWARSMGVPARRIDRPGGMERRRERKLPRSINQGPVVLDIRIDRDIRFAGGGRNEALQHMSMLAEKVAS